MKIGSQEQSGQTNQPVSRAVRLMALTATVAVTACGGGTNTAPEDIAAALPVSTSEPSSAPDVIDVTPARDNVFIDVPVAESLEPNDLAPEGDPVVPDAPDTEIPVPDAAELNALIAGAADVGCEAGAAAFSDTMLALINETRSQARACGLEQLPAADTLTWNAQLTEAASAHALDMSGNNFFSHTGSNGLSVVERSEAAGYQWRAIGENIAAGQIDMDEVHTGWVESPGHCRNIMSENFTEVGAACSRDSSADYGTYWVVVFGAAR